MSLTIVRDAGAYGFDTTPITGTGLSAAAIATQQTELEQARLLADALGLAIAQARAQGAAGFRPADLGALLPAGLAGADSSAAGQLREQLFSQRLGLAYGSARPATLAEWSRALDALQHWVGATASRLPPGLGGGTCCVQGSWYVNGEPYSLAELFTANRVNTFAEIDTQLAAALNVIAANNEATKALTGLMKLMFDKYESMANFWSINSFSYRISDQWVDAVGQFTQAPDVLTKQQNAFQRPDSQYGPTRWTETHIYGAVADPTRLGDSAYAASVPLDHPIAYATLLQYAEKYIGPDSLIRKLQTNPGLMKEDFRAMIDEVEKIIAAKAQDNQVAQLRNQTLMDSRASLLDGLSGFLKGQQGTRSAVSRNL
jgi:hypothetical protein